MKNFGKYIPADFISARGALDTPQVAIVEGVGVAYKRTTDNDYTAHNGTKDFAKLFPNNNEIWYTSTDGNIVTPYSATGFGANIISNTYENGKGVITFDGDITSAGTTAFYRCTNLSSIVLPISVVKIGSSAFDTCSNLSSIALPSSVTTILSSAFQRCTSLSSIVLPNTIDKIQTYAFRDCTKLSSIRIPASATNIGAGAFTGCNNITSIVVDSDNAVYNDGYGSNCIIKTSTSQLAFGCITTIIPYGVTSIGAMAFVSGQNIPSLTIPASVTAIQMQALIGASFGTITIEAIQPPTYGTNALSKSPNAIYVPAESVDAYKTASGWSAFADKIQAIP